MKTPFLGGTYKSLSALLNAQRCINLYPEMVETRDGKEVAGFYRVSGKKPWIELTYQFNGDEISSGPVRGDGVVVGGYQYLVAGAQFFRINLNGTFVIVGTLQGRTGPVSLKKNNNSQILIVDGKKAYGYDTRGVKTITGKALTVTGGDSYGGTPRINNAAQVNGAGQTGASLITDGWPASITLPTGFKFKISGVDAFGSSDPCEFSLSAPAVVNGSGQATLAISPAIVVGSTVTAGPSNNAALTVIGQYILSDGWTPSITLPAGLRMTFAGCYEFGLPALQVFALQGAVAVTAAGVAILNVTPLIAPSGANENVTGTPADNAEIAPRIAGGDPVTSQEGQSGTQITTAGWAADTLIPVGLTFTVAGLFEDGTGIPLEFTTTAQAITSSTGAVTLAVTPGISTGSTFGNIVLPFVGAGPAMASFQDGFFLINETGTQNWWQSGLNDVFTWNGLNFSSEDSQPDPIVGLIELGRQQWLFGSTSTAVWVNAGTSGFAFQRLQGVFIEQGCAAPFSICRSNTAIFWVGNSELGFGAIWQTEGYQPKRISTHAIEYALRDYPTIADCRAYTYEDAGHLFVVFTFPAGNATWVYDVTTGLWAERAEFTHGQWTRDAASGHTVFGGAHVLGDYRSGQLYKYDPTYTTGLKWLRSWPAFAPGKTPTGRPSFSYLTIDAQGGVGNSVAPGENPQVMLRWSDDNGQTFRNEKQASLGKTGEITTSLMWRRLGSSRQRNINRVWEISCTEPIFTALIAADMGVEAGE